jgi:hypothetical protein
MPDHSFTLGESNNRRHDESATFAGTALQASVKDGSRLTQIPGDFAGGHVVGRAIDAHPAVGDTSDAECEDLHLGGSFLVEVDG